MTVVEGEYQPAEQGPRAKGIGWRPDAWNRVLFPNFTVIGLGRSGLAAANALAAYGAPVQVADEYDTAKIRADAEKLPSDVPVFLGGIPAPRPDGVYVVSPGFVADSPRYFDLVESGHQVVDETEVFYNLMRERFPDRPCRIIGVTGTNGKTSTTELIGHLLREAGVPCVVGGNIGVPLCTQLDGLTSDTVVVAELSEITLLGQNSFHSNVAVITNIDDDHVIGLPVFGGVAANYHASKWRITRRLTADDMLVYNTECPNTSARVDRSAVDFQLVPIGPSPQGSGVNWRMSGSDYCRNNGQGASPEVVAHRSDVSTLTVQEERAILGDHNDRNVLMALAAATAVGAGASALRRGLGSFRAPAHRLNLLSGMPHGKVVIDDSKSTNPHAALVALQIARREYPTWRIVWLGGGQTDQLPKGGLAADVAKYADVAVLAGESGPEIAELVRPLMPVRLSRTLEESVHAAFEELGDEPGVLLFSPAAKSFDKFSNFAERASAFREAVGEALGGRSSTSD